MLWKERLEFGVTGYGFVGITRLGACAGALEKSVGEGFPFAPRDGVAPGVGGAIAWAECGGSLSAGNRSFAREVGSEGCGKELTGETRGFRSVRGFEPSLCLSDPLGRVEGELACRETFEGAGAQAVGMKRIGLRRGVDGDPSGEFESLCRCECVRVFEERRREVRSGFRPASSSRRLSEDRAP
jgi:hypothetical protein